MDGQNNRIRSDDIRAGKGWSEVPAQSLDAWNVRLEATECSYRQYPFWVEPHRLWKFTPRFFCYGDVDNPGGFVSILESRKFPFRIGLMDRGPFLFGIPSVDEDQCITRLVELTKELGYDFVRFTEGQESVFKRCRALKSVGSIEPYPFCRDSRNSLIVEQKASDDEMMAGFDKKVRYEIRRASSAGYEIRTASSDADFERVWRLFEDLASRKRFKLSTKPKAVWRETLKLGSAKGLARLYLCSLAGQLVAARLSVRDGVMDEDILSGLDVELLGGGPSPAPLLVWFVMRDAHKLGCKYYNLGGPGDPKQNNHVLQFKKKFKPVLKIAPEPLCLVLHPSKYWLWSKVCLRGWRAWRGHFQNSGPRYQENVEGGQGQIMNSHQPDVT